jgi:toxin ParE1/3/4
MAAFRFTRRAESDLDDIGDHSVRNWGPAQAARYLGELEICCQSLANNPSLGRICEYLRLGLRRFEYGMHVVFYLENRGGILIARIVHQSMLPEKHFLGDQDEQ